MCVYLHIQIYTYINKKNKDLYKINSPTILKWYIDRSFV